MAAADYYFVDRWRVRGAIEEVSDIIGAKGTDLPRWWPSTYSDAVELEAGEPDGTGAVFTIRGRGWLPYALHLQFTGIASNRPNGFTLAVDGDLEGTGEWTFVQDGDYADITFDWRVRVNKAGVRQLSPLLKPIFRSNHHWTMVQGERSLEIELARRHGIPTELPPGPFRLPLRRLAAPVAGLGAVVIIGWRRLRKGA